MIEALNDRYGAQGWNTLDAQNPAIEKPTTNPAPRFIEPSVVLRPADVPSYTSSQFVRTKFELAAYDTDIELLLAASLEQVRKELKKR